MASFTKQLWSSTATGVLMPSGSVSEASNSKKSNLLQVKARAKEIEDLFADAALGLLFALGAQAQTAAQTAQQSKMTTCNAEAKDMKGDERKAFMKDCLSGKKMTPQQVKMKTCNAEATGKKGDERKKFMSECLKK